MNRSMIVLVIVSVVVVTSAGPGTSRAVTCPALEVEEHVEVTCVRRGKVVDCTQAVPTETVATFSCRVGSFSSGNITTSTTTCSSDGSWTKGGVACHTGCGLAQDVTTVQLHGEDVQDGLLPWHIRVYLKGYSDWLHQCVGTLITPTHVITAAYCVGGFTAAHLQLAARKLITDFSLTEPNSQLRGVRQVIKHEQFDSEGNWNNDIAVLVADSSFVLSTTVNVACVDWTGLLAPTSGSTFIGPAVVRGKNNTRRELTAAQRFTLVNDVTCRAQSRSEQLRYLTDDKFCARQSDNVTCDDSDGGGLMMTSAGGRHYLSGVRSTSLTYTVSGGCWTDRLNSYTNISRHLVWLKLHTAT